MRLQRDLRRVLVADVRIERGDEHQRLVDVARGCARVGLDAARAALVERAEAVGQELDRLEHVVQDDRLVDVELEVALRAGEGHGGVVAEHLHGDHRQRLALRRVDLARHDRRARLVVGDRDLAEARARAARVQRTSLAIFIAMPPSVRSAALALTMASCADSAANLLGADMNGLPVACAMCCAASSPKRAGALMPVPTAVPPSASGYSASRA